MPAKPEPTTLVRRPATGDSFARDAAKTQGRRLARTSSGGAIDQLHEYTSGATLVSSGPRRHPTRAHHMLCHDSQRRSPLVWAAVNGQPTRCAARLPENALESQPDSRVNLDRTAGPEPGDNSARTPLETARLAGDELPPACPIHQLLPRPGGGSLTARISCVAGEPRPPCPTPRQ